MARHAELGSYLIKVRLNMQAKIDDIAQKSSIETASKIWMPRLKRRPC